MIVTETVEINGGVFTHNYSDANFMIHKIGTDEIYAETYDVLDFAYEETDTPLDTPAPTETDMREALGILGVNL